MQLDNLVTVLLIIGVASSVFYGIFRISRYAFVVNFLLIGTLVYYLNQQLPLVQIALYLVCPLILINIGMYVFLHKTDHPKNGNVKYQVNFATTKGNFKIDNIKRGASIIGSAGSGLSLIHISEP